MKKRTEICKEPRKEDGHIDKNGKNLKAPPSKKDDAKNNNSRI